MREKRVIWAVSNCIMSRTLRITYYNRIHEKSTWKLLSTWLYKSIASSNAHLSMPICYVLEIYFRFFLTFVFLYLTIRFNITSDSWHIQLYLNFIVKWFFFHEFKFVYQVKCINSSKYISRFNSSEYKTL